VQFVSDRTWYITLRGRWWDTAVLNAHTSTDNKCDGI
jgi:hypothetical protein